MGRDELPFLIGSAVVILAVAQWSDPDGIAQFAILAAAVVAFVVRGSWATMRSELFAVLVIAPVGVAIAANGKLEVAFFLVVVMVVYTSSHLGSTTRALVIAASAAAAPLVVARSLGGDAINATPWVAANAFTFVLGRNLRRQRELIAQLEATRTALVEVAVTEERRRIARELHDLAGHTLAAVVLHVTGARHVLRRDVDEAERALLDAETVGRASLDQIRAAVATLRTTERGAEPPLAGGADLGALVEEYRRAGLSITATLPSTSTGGRSSADATILSGPVGTALHRIARESLANVARHAPSNRVEVTVETIGGRDGCSAGVRLVVADHGCRPPTRRPDPTSFGLVGMGERARGLGGELTAGPSGDGWRVEASLPLPGVERSTGS